MKCGEEIRGEKYQRMLGEELESVQGVLAMQLEGIRCLQSQCVVVSRVLCLPSPLVQCGLSPHKHKRHVAGVQSVIAAGLCIRCSSLTVQAYRYK